MDSIVVFDSIKYFEIIQDQQLEVFIVSKFNNFDTKQSPPLAFRRWDDENKVAMSYDFAPDSFRRSCLREFPGNQDITELWVFVCFYPYLF